MKKNTILVPVDFTEVSQCAINHAVNIATGISGELVLLHVISKDTEQLGATEKLKKLAADTQAANNLKVKQTVIKGNIFDDIGGVAETINARLIVMGTHGIKGMQNITGSYALKVISNSKVPFIVVQKKDPAGRYSNIVLPINMAVSTKLKLRIASEVALYFNSKVHIIAPKETDQFIVNKVVRNIRYARKFLSKNGVPHTTTIAKGDAGFTQEVVNHAKAVNADMISIVNSRNNGITHLFGKGYEQNIITNEDQIPVLCVNARSVQGGTNF